jgi:hypothetical protein
VVTPGGSVVVGPGAVVDVPGAGGVVVVFFGGVVVGPSWVPGVQPTQAVVVLPSTLDGGVLVELLELELELELLLLGVVVGIGVVGVVGTVVCWHGPMVVESTQLVVVGPLLGGVELELLLELDVLLELLDGYVGALELELGYVGAVVVS